MTERKWTFIAAAAAALLCINPVSADISGGAEITISGQAKSVCRVAGGSQKSASNAQFANNAIIIGKLTDDSLGTVNDSSVQIVFSEAMCNYSAMITLATANGGLKPTVPLGEGPTGNFVTKVDYIVDGTWGGVPLPLLDTSALAAGGIVKKEAGKPINGELILNVSTRKGSIPAIAATYQDILIVKVGAQY